jgi:hypothetical protein
MLVPTHRTGKHSGPLSDCFCSSLHLTHIFPDVDEAFAAWSDAQDAIMGAIKHGFVKRGMSHRGAPWFTFYSAIFERTIEQNLQNGWRKPSIGTAGVGVAPRLIQFTR